MRIFSILIRIFLVVLCLNVIVLSCGKEPKQIPKPKKEQKKFEEQKESIVPGVQDNQEEQAIKNIFKELQEKFKKIDDYQCILETFVAKDDKSDKRIYNYYFKKDKQIRMEIVEGEDKGTHLIYNEGKVKVKPGCGLSSLFTFTFTPDDKSICDLRGFGVHQSDWGTFIEEHLTYLKKYTGKIGGKEEVEKKEAMVIEIKSKKPEDTMSVAQEKIWIDTKEKIILKFEQYDQAGKLIRSNYFKDIKMNQGLKDELFKKP